VETKIKSRNKNRDSEKKDSGEKNQIFKNNIQIVKKKYRYSEKIGIVEKKYIVERYKDSVKKLRWWKKA